MGATFSYRVPERKAAESKGFTLLELLLVIGILAVLSAVTTIVINPTLQLRKARVSRAASDLRAIQTAVQRYFLDNNKYPCFDHTWDDTKEKTWAGSYILWPKTPWKTEYHWEHGSGFTYSISMRDVPQADARLLDEKIDDNNLTTGILKDVSGGDPIRYEFGDFNQSEPLNDCHI